MKEISRKTGLCLGKKQNGTGKNLFRNTFPFEETYYVTYIFLINI